MLNARTRTIFPHVTILIILICATICYLPGLSGDFVFDDIPNIVDNAAIHALASDPSPSQLRSAALSYDDGKRPFSMMTVALNYLASDLNPTPYKIFNISIHLINGLLLFLFARALIQSSNITHAPHPSLKASTLIALFVCSAWLLQPTNVTGVLYVIQRMTSLSALFCLLGMLLYTQGRLRLIRAQPGGTAMILAAIVVATPLAFLSKENGILLPAYLLLIEWIIFGFAKEDPAHRRRLAGLFIVIVGLPAMLAASFLVTHPNWITDGYYNRPFTLEERVLTESRVLWLYLKLLVLPRLADLSLFHDDIPLSTGLIQPWTTLPALLGLAALPVIAVLIRRRRPLVAFGLLFFLTGHVLESSIFPLEIAHEHRNYLPGIGILLALTSLATQWPSNRRAERLGIALMLALTLLFGTLTAMRSAVWGDPYRLAVTGVTDHPRSNRWQHQMGQTLWMAHESSENPEQRAALHASARRHFLNAAALDSFYAPGNLLSLIQIDSSAGREPDQAIVGELLARLPDGPVAPFTVTTFVTLLECLSGPHCSRPIPETERLITAFLRNPRLGNAERGKLLAAATQYAINRVGLEAALRYATAAVETNPSELQHHLNLAQLLIYAGEMGQARERLRFVQDHDSRNVFQVKRERLEKQIPSQ